MTQICQCILLFVIISASSQENLVPRQFPEWNLGAKCLGRIDFCRIGSGYVDCRIYPLIRYWRLYKLCYKMFTQGPCQKCETLIFDHMTKLPKCVKNTCIDSIQQDGEEFGQKTGQGRNCNDEILIYSFDCPKVSTNELLTIFKNIAPRASCSPEGPNWSDKHMGCRTDRVITPTSSENE